ncbi:MAG: hypothetical protein N2746_04015 [Deltaproteobacteria bacterium]|nr:hypothetical protein [Deltaproteobacteria bacterium]
MRKYILLFAMLSIVTTCGPEDYYLVISGIRPPEDDCTYKPGELFRAWGVADASLITTAHNYGYVAGVQVQNRMLNTKDVTKKPGAMDELPMRTDANTVVVKKAVVELRGVVASKNTTTTTKYKSTYSMEISETVVPSAGDEKTPGVAIVLFSLIPKEKLIELEEGVKMPEWPTDPSTYVDLIAEFYLEGETLGGVPVKTNVFNFYVRVCYGCLNFLGNKTIADCVMDARCKLVGGTCVPGQDGYIACVCQ